MSEIILEKLDDNRLLLPQTGGMRVPGIIYANEKIYQLLRGDESAKQVANVARTTVARDAWRRGQPLAVHGWVYGMHDGLVRDLGATVGEAAGPAAPLT